MNQEANDYYNSLLGIYLNEESSLTMKYRQMRDLLERLCRHSIQNERLQMTDLSARISYLASVANLSRNAQNQLHTFRLTSNAVMNRREEPTHEFLLRDLRTLALTVKSLLQEDIPQALYDILPRQADIPVSPVSVPHGKRIKRIRVCFQYSDETYLYVIPADRTVDEPLKVHYGVATKNEEFNETVSRLWLCAQLNLIDVTVDEEGVYTPSMIVLEPDYLIDISTLAECFKDYGHHPANYLLGRLQSMSNTRALLLGNIANLFLDEWIHADGEADYMECMRKAFRTYPIELASCEDLLDPKTEFEFFNDCKAHFEHLKEVVTDTFLAPGYHLNKEDAVLEPSYVCEALGLQGRLDYMQRDMSSFIEMKSGKADEYTIKGKIEPKENHKVQMLLYMAVLEYSMGVSHRKVHPYLLYTRYPLLYPARPSWALVRRAINLRNLIVAGEHAVQLHNRPQYTAQVLSEIAPAVLNENHLHGMFWERYLSPSITAFGTSFSALTPLEQSYYLTLYNFIVKEQYTSKSGEMEYDGRAGSASLWLASLDEKREAGEILYDLTIKENRAADAHKATVVFAIPHYEEEFLPNFRVGDVVLFYERNKADDTATNKMVFKGSIASIDSHEITVRIRASQQNPSVLPQGSTYAVEHDSMDTAYKGMFQALTLFAEANKDRRDLLLAQRKPWFDTSLDEQIARAKDDFTRVTLKAQSAKDFFLLVGPPGTGKTSRALKQMVEEFYKNSSEQILLLAYTNRAVDEICKSISSISPEIDYIRVGSELSCEERFRPRLIENVLSTCNRRSEVSRRITDCRVIVGTVASISTKPDLFRLKKFDVAIVDEATQILEPQLLGILCARDRAGQNAIGKFVLIGDHKQLPAVVLQSEDQSRICSDDLLSVGITNLKDSLFERLYRTYSKRSEGAILPNASTLPQDTDLPGGVNLPQGDLELNSRAVDMLCKQGRMNPLVALFPNKAFYGGKLEPVGLPHQMDTTSPYGARVQFIPSRPHTGGASDKCNIHEARLAADIAVEVYLRSPHKFDVTRTLGIITPYRSQIAMIKKELALRQISALNDILVDTVERFQGSERDVIIYSFSVNYPWQLQFLSNVTEEDGVQIDRKLNVALTRARNQMYIIGVPELLKLNKIYEALIKLILPTLH